MILLQKPKAGQLQAFLARQAKANFSYSAIGATAANPPSSYVVDHTRVELGQGQGVYEGAKSALEGWLQFRTGWLEIWPGDSAIREGRTVVIVARSVGVWWLNACRIVYVIPDQVRGPGLPRQFGFAYGTLADHVGSGEERFLVEMDAGGRVWYDILAFSRPQHPLARLGYPFVRLVQKQFGRASSAAMRRAVTQRQAAATCPG